MRSASTAATLKASAHGTGKLVYIVDKVSSPRLLEVGEVVPETKTLRPPFQCAVLSLTRSVCLLFVTCQPAYYKSYGSGVRNHPLTTNTDTHSRQPPSSPAPSVSIAIGQNKLLIIGHGLS